ncbi:MAG TPA: AzlD domain-containing protein [Limnochordales bacterium]
MSVRAEMVALFLAVGVGTYLMRAVPLWMARRSLTRHGGQPRRPDSPQGQGEEALWALRLVTPAVIAALLVASVLPERGAPGAWAHLAASVAALVPAAWVQARWGNLGLTVLTGVVLYGLAAWAA